MYTGRIQDKHLIRINNRCKKLVLHQSKKLFGDIDHLEAQNRSCMEDMPPEGKNSGNIPKLRTVISNN